MSAIAEVVLTVATSAGVGGLIGATGTYRLGAKKLPAELDSMAVQGAETAVQTLIHSLAIETARADRAEDAVRERDARIAALETKIDVLYTALDAVRDELHAIKTSGCQSN